MTVDLAGPEYKGAATQSLLLPVVGTRLFRAHAAGRSAYLPASDLTDDIGERLFVTLKTDGRTSIRGVCPA
jgi:hypothetical protein